MPPTRSMVYGVWCVVCGVWCMVLGMGHLIKVGKWDAGMATVDWCMVYGVCCMVYGV